MAHSGLKTTFWRDGSQTNRATRSLAESKYIKDNNAIPQALLDSEFTLVEFTEAITAMNKN